jgi:hypothetical protein
MQVCRTDRLYHYLINGEEALSAILAAGLLPLSAMPESPRWQQLASVRPGFYRDLYAQFAEPVIRRPYSNSGIFLTPIEFRLLPGLALATALRIAVPLAAIERESAALTYEGGGERVILPLTPETLLETARQWPAEVVRAWFGRDRSKIFFHVPQVAAYQEGGIPVSPEWVERIAAS